MQISGPVLGDPRDSSFPSKKKGEEGKMITMVYFDLYDTTARMVSCEMVKDSFPLSEGMKIVADVTRMKELPFAGGGIVLAIRNVRPLVDQAPVVPVPPMTVGGLPVSASAPEGVAARRPAPPR